MPKHKFIHCGDLHLGCKPSHLDQRYEDFFESFKELIDNAINNKCEYVIISGDLFHLKVINSKTLLKVINLLEYAKQYNIKTIVIEGNHDKAFFVDEESWLNFLYEKGYIILLSHSIENSQLQITNNSIYEDENIRVIGIGYLGSTTSIYLKGIENKISKSDKFTILMLHAAVNRLSGEDMGDIHLNTLKPLKGVVDYIALGHIHTKYEYDELIYNPGSLENIRLKEGRKSDQKGYYIVEYNENKEKEVTFNISKKREIYNKDIKLENNLRIEEAETYIKNYEFECMQDAILEITVYGNVSFNPFLINFEDIKEHIKTKYNLLYVDVNNLINLVNNKELDNSIIDIKTIEEDAINKYIQTNYPTIEDIKSLTNDILDIKNAIIEEKEYNQIIELMIGQVIKDETN